MCCLSHVWLWLCVVMVMVVVAIMLMVAAAQRCQRVLPNKYTREFDSSRDEYLCLNTCLQQGPPLPSELLSRLPIVIVAVGVFLSMSLLSAHCQCVTLFHCRLVVVVGHHHLTPPSPCPMAVAGVVAALAGCWRQLVVFMQLEAASADLRHVVLVFGGARGLDWSEILQPHMKMAITERAWKRLLPIRPQWLSTLNIQDYDNHKLASTSNTMTMACHGHPNDDYDTADCSSNNDDDTLTKCLNNEYSFKMSTHATSMNMSTRSSDGYLCCMENWKVGSWNQFQPPITGRTTNNNQLVAVRLSVVQWR
ncbi:hypothetical protein EDB89DRAFT_1915160 [Lactarius sanguifluus]|nr:hypothetical protein EDB89DRAFT_1915160 [Lactarius sanguifluus]